MKKLFTLAVLALSINAFGQFNTGGIYFSGLTNLGTGLEIDGGVPSILFGLNTEAGYFIKNKIAVGGGIHADLNMPFGNSGSFYNSIYDINFGPNVRYYFPRENDWHLYAFGNVHYGLYQDQEEEFLLQRHQYFGFQIGPGVNYFFNERIALDARFSYRYRYAWNAAMGGSHTVHRFFFEVGITVFFPSLTFFDKS